MRSPPAVRGAWVRNGIAAPRCRLAARLAIVAGLALLGARPAAAAGDEQGQQIATTCASCHGPVGGDQGIPVITGLDQQTIIRAMQAFRANITPSHVMHAVALALTDEEVASVAHYLATHGDKASSP